MKTVTGSCKMNTGRCLVAFLVLLIMYACNSQEKPRGTDLFPEMAQTDSLELIYFRTPDSPRYFTYLPTTDKEFIEALVSDVSGEVQPENPCMKEGKVYCFTKGEIKNTIYFAYQDPGCVVLRFIKNGKLYYFNMSETVQEKLASYKSIALDPDAAAGDTLSNNK